MLLRRYPIGRCLRVFPPTLTKHPNVIRKYVQPPRREASTMTYTPFKCSTISSTNLAQQRISNITCTQIDVTKQVKRFYNPRENINWTLIRFRHRVSQLRKKKLKYKNHSKVALRFRLTRFGWERLQSGRNASKRNLSIKKYNEKMKIKYVSRDDIKKFKFQMPSYVLRLRDSPVDYNPNIMRARKFLPSHFG